MKKHLSISKLIFSLVICQLLLTACPKKPCNAGNGLTKYACTKYTMMEDSTGILYETVTDTLIYVYFDFKNVSILGDNVALNEDDSYSGYHTVCGNNTFYLHITPSHEDLETAYEIPIGDSTLHVTYIGRAN
jgi:hypothetical protein